MSFQRPKKKKMSRDEKAQLTYDNLMEAASRIVGEEGYAATTVAKVTAEAGVAHGTFYNYFEDRQGLFDVLLPYVGRQMTSRISEALPENATGLEREIARFRAYCDYLRDTPGFYRVLYEAEVFAPAAHAEHIKRLSDGYCRALKRSMGQGFMRAMNESELDATVAVLLGARAYIAMQHKADGNIPESAITAYEKLIRCGLFQV